MQGNLNEIDLPSILQLIELGQRTGLLFVETIESTGHSYPQCKQQSWFVFFVSGQIVYCQNHNSHLSRLRDLLWHYRVKLRIQENQLTSLESLTVPEYSYLWALLERNIITPSQARSIVRALVHESLFDLLGLSQGYFIFEPGLPLTPQLTTLEIAPLIGQTIQQIQEWKQLYPYIQSPDQFPVLINLNRLRSSLPASTVNKLQNWVDGKTSMRQLARYLHTDILTVGRAIYPYIQHCYVKLVYSDTLNERSPLDHRVELQQSKPARIVCIDDSLSICEIIQSMMKLHYEIITFTDSMEALRLVFQLQPDLILCDIAMPQLDGYEICAMLRHSKTFRLIPIIMLTGKSSYIDRVKANMVGATDYLTKPFRDTELLTLMDNYLKKKYFVHSQKIH